eukprot:m.63927 g.63927  ORF g.63927 m.63927 type:complete len:68 (+) comp8094_c1_seq3:435-638(+)
MDVEDDENTAFDDVEVLVLKVDDVEEEIAVDADVDVDVDVDVDADDVTDTLLILKARIVLTVSSYVG